MLKLPIISGKKVVRKLERVGYKITRQKGSHVRMKSSDLSRKPITIPLHKTIKPGLLFQIMKDAGLSLAEFVDL